jgi:sensor histidine kinase YesM
VKAAFLRYKLYHIPFWFVYGYLWWVIYSRSFVDVLHGLMSVYFIKFSFYWVWETLAVYFNLYYLIPRLLERNKVIAYIVSVVLLVAVMSLLITPGYYVTAWVQGRSMNQVWGEGATFWNLLTANPLPSATACMTLAMTIHLSRSWYQARQRQQVLEREKLETELKFLRNQFNPHFLFNTINSIFFLIHKNPGMASDSLAKFSDLLRYQLYECNDKEIPLARELAYMENFVELEKLRQNANVSVDLDVRRTPGQDRAIAPFVLITFVENAFKHVSRSTDSPNWIKIGLGQVDDQLDFVVSNSTAPGTHSEVIHYGGIGLANVRRRLDLLYPGAYDLFIHSSDCRFDVRLQLKLQTLLA